MAGLRDGEEINNNYEKRNLIGVVDNRRRLWEEIPGHPSESTQGFPPYGMRIYGRTFKESMPVRREEVWPYGQRVSGRTAIDPLNDGEQE